MPPNHVPPTRAPVFEPDSARRLITKTKHRLYTLVLLIVALGLMELGAYLVAQKLAKNGKGLYFPCISESYEDFLSRLHPGLGWPSPDFISKRPGYFDEVGSRVVPEFPDPLRHSPCVSLYGDSYTEGFGVSHEEAWGNVLARLLNCRVANFGISGYGSDQAYLRYQQNRADRANITILSHFTQNIARNVNQLRNFLGPSAQCQLKPRFILDPSGRLDLVPVFSPSREAYQNLEKDPGRYLKHEFFLPGGPSGLRMASFPYLLSLLRAAPAIARFLSNPAYWRELYEPDHPSQALPLTLAIMKQFREEARARGQQAIIFILPSRGDIKLHLTGEPRYYQSLIAALRQENVEVLDIGERFSQALGGQNPAVLFDPESNYHYSAYGNKVLAEIAADYLQKRTAFSDCRPFSSRLRKLFQVL